jgi:DNA-binding transcriptional MerR regulator
MQSEIPDKLYFKIGEVSKIADVAPHVLRYWESEFSAIRPKRANSKQRLYRRVDVEIVLKIKMLLHGRGYTISGARRFLAGGEEISQEFSAPVKLDVSTCLGRIKDELLRVQEILTEKKSV